AKVGGNARAKLRQDGGKLLEPVELVAVAMRTPLRVIAVLLPAAGVAAGRLQVSFRIRTDPDVLPRRRNRKRANAFQIRWIANGSAVGAHVTEAKRAHLAAEAGSARGD